MKLFISKKQNGVGLIEVLITTVVIAIGLLAVASLQGEFLSSSGSSKIRSEALTLAEQKIEEFRNNIKRGTLADTSIDECIGVNASIDGYLGICPPLVSDTAPVYPEVIIGSNTSFTRTWVVSAGGSEDRKKIAVTISWDNDGDSDTVNDDEKINITTEMTFIDPAKTALYALASAGGTAAVPSPRQNASEDVNSASENVVGTNLDIVASAGGTTGAAGTDENLTVDLPDNGGSFIVYQVAPYSHFYTSTTATGVAPGVIAVFLCDNGYCSHIQNHFGGVVHRVKGTVYSTSDNGLSNVLVAWTSSDVHACYVGTSSSSGNLDSMPYECVYAGNCNTTSSGSRTASGNDAIIPGCFVDAIVSDDQINSRNVGPGGEFGDVGLIGLVAQGTGGLNTEQVCFLEDTTDPSTSPLLNTSGSDVLNENYLFSVTKRLYITRRIKYNTSDSINDHKSEGINRSYDNHNFFIIAKGNGAGALTQCNTQLTTYLQQIAPREISRAYNQNTDNIVQTEATYSGGTGTAKFITGNVTSSATQLRLFIPETGTCYLNNALDRSTDATGYACVVASDTVSIDVIGSSNQHQSTNPSVFDSCTKLVDGNPGCHWLTDFDHNYVDGGAINNDCSTPWGASLVNGSSVDAYAISDCSTAISRTCNSGVLEGTDTAIYDSSSSCTLASTNSVCSSPWLNGPDINHGASITAFTAASVDSSSSCPTGITRTCNDGTLDGDITAIYQNCTVDAFIGFDIDVTPAGGSGTAITTCNGGACLNIVAGTYTVAIALSGGSTCTGSYTLSNSDILIQVTKAAGGGSTCTMTTP